MARYNEFAGPKLPTQLLEKVYGGRVDKHGKAESSRKEKRKAERQAKKKVPLRTKKPVKWAKKEELSESEDEDEEVEVKKSKSAVPAKDAKPVKSILKTRPTSAAKVEVIKPVVKEEEGDDEEDEEEEETDIDLHGEEDVEDDDDDDFTISREAARAKLNDDDDVIAALERKLGMKGGKKSKTITDDEWDFLMTGDLGEGEDEDEDGEGDDPLPSINGKRKRGKVEGKSAADEAWLESKRKKARGVEKKGEKARGVEKKGEKARGMEKKGEKASTSTSSTSTKLEAESEDEQDEQDDVVVAAAAAATNDDDDMDGLANPFSDDEMSADDFDEYEDSEDEEDDDEDEPEESSTALPPTKRQRENPYVAPVTDSSISAPKYIPPSLRKASTSDEEVLKNLRRQVQGQLNRLSEANLPSIHSSILEMYSSNARQHVTSVLIDLLTHLISDPAVLTDPFLILHAAFATALYRSLGPDFGAPLLESLVQSFDTHHSSPTSQKQPLNLLAFLSTLYTLQSISHNIIFDYIRLLLSTFSESSTELLLRIIRISGPQLRQDDPSALKDIVLILQRETAKLGGEANLSVRTKFMMETILNLKNNRVKTGVAAKALSAEHMLRMKKTLGGIKGVKTTEPLRITLEDIRDSEKKGKWWLVGASYKDPLKYTTTTVPVPSATTTTTTTAGDEDDLGRDLSSLARSQGMNTSVRSALFVAITGAVDFQHAQLRIGKLNLKKNQLKEIPRVLVHCVGMEGVYNHFYTLVGMLFAGEEGGLKRAWGGVLGDVLGRIERSHDGGYEDGEGEGEGEGEEGMGVKEIYCIAKMYAGLIAEGLLSLTLLKNVDFADLSPPGKIFLRVLCCTIFVLLRQKAAKQVGAGGKGAEHSARKTEVFEESVREVFERCHAVPDMVLGVRYAVEKIVRGSAGEVLGGGKAGKKGEMVVEEGCEFAVQVLSEPPKKGRRVEFEGRGGEEDSD